MKNLFKKKFLYRIRLPVVLLILLMLTACGTKTSKYRGDVKGLDVAKTAQSQVGKKYRYGGESPSKGFDCSGLIWWSYKKHGITVPRVTSGQAKTGKKVLSKHAKAGDIVVFRMGKNSNSIHTGIYAGGNKFIHSPSSGSRVRVESISSYWKPKLIAVRRVIY